MDSILFSFTPSPIEMIVIAAIAVMLFGKRLPEIGKTLGKGLIEFKKGIRGVEDNITSAAESAPAVDEIDETGDGREQTATAPRFEIPSE